jgi:hypothetical protein
MQITAVDNLAIKFVKKVSLSIANTVILSHRLPGHFDLARSSTYQLHYAVKVHCLFTIKVLIVILVYIQFKLAHSFIFISFIFKHFSSHIQHILNVWIVQSVLGR